MVWDKTQGVAQDIYLYTLDSSLPCPEAAFTAAPTSGVSPLTVQFSNSSTGSPTYQSWDFGDGTTSTDQNPVHTYAADGIYSVALTVSNAVGRDYTARTGYIRVGPVPVVSFSANQTYGIAPLPVQFTDTSSGEPSAGRGTSVTGVPPRARTRCIPIPSAGNLRRPPRCHECQRDRHGYRSGFCHGAERGKPPRNHGYRRTPSPDRGQQAGDCPEHHRES